jgi:hypothetical protein
MELLSITPSEVCALATSPLRMTQTGPDLELRTEREQHNKVVVVLMCNMKEKCTPGPFLYYFGD